MNIKIVVAFFGCAVAVNLQSSPLHDAVKKNDINRASTLLGRGANIDEQNGQGDTPLYIAVKNNNVEMVSLLLRSGADVNLSNKDGRTSLYAALNNLNDYHKNSEIRGPIEKAKNIINGLFFHNVDVNKADNKGVAPLHLSAAAASFQTFKDLLVRKANPNVATREGITPLHVAAMFAKPEYIDVLIKNGAKPNKVDKYGNTPLHVAVLIKNYNANMLLEHGANPNVANHDGITPLHMLMSVGRQYNEDEREIYKGLGLVTVGFAIAGVVVSAAGLLVAGTFAALVLIGFGITSEFIDLFSMERKVTLLLDKGAKVNAKDHLGNTPLHILAAGMIPKKRGIQDVITAKKLIDHGAQVDVKNKSGFTPYDIAREFKRTGLMTLFRPSLGEVAKDVFVPVFKN